MYLYILRKDNMSKKIEVFLNCLKRKINWITQMPEDAQKAKEIVSTYNHSNERFKNSR